MYPVQREIFGIWGRKDSVGQTRGSNPFINGHALLKDLRIFVFDFCLNIGGRDLKISKNTYGLILISNNCYKILEDDIPNGLKIKLKKIDFINSWTLFGVHDTAILVQSSGRLDNAVSVIGDWIEDLNERETPIDDFIPALLKDSGPLIKSERERIIEFYQGNNDKIFKVFEYRVDPLIPIYLDEKN
jgi:hypothetical protein